VYLAASTYATNGIDIYDAGRNVVYIAWAAKASVVASADSNWCHVVLNVCGCDVNIGCQFYSSNAQFKLPVPNCNALFVTYAHIYGIFINILQILLWIVYFSIQIPVCLLWISFQILSRLQSFVYCYPVDPEQTDLRQRRNDCEDYFHLPRED
jgi:hypothetical protein